MSDMITPGTTSIWSSEAINALSDREVVARTGWAEARGLGEQGMQATISVGQNRVLSGVRWWGTTLRQVFLRKWQFSCWNPKDPNRPKLLAVTEADPQYKIALGLADAAIDGRLPDISGGCDSYYDRRMPKAPLWARGLTPRYICGTQLYFKTV